LSYSTRNLVKYSTASGSLSSSNTLALNLATAYAQTGNKVLLIDAD
jgi:Mrp family chromosome partitioning ATPase